MVFGGELLLALIVGDDDVCCGNDGDIDVGEEEKYEDVDGVGDDGGVVGRGVDGVERTCWERDSAELMTIGLWVAPATLDGAAFAGACGATFNCFAIASCVDRAWFLACAAATAGGGVTAAGLNCSVVLG